MSEGSAVFDGIELIGAGKDRLNKLRGVRMAMIFQDPMTSLNPLMKIGAQIAEPLRIHLGMTSGDALATAERLLNDVRIPEAHRRLDQYPHELSGGMRQRVMIAMALINDPDLIIADEPTTALDVTTQAQILALMNRLQEEHGMAIIMITHDLGVVAEVAEDVIVMYGGQVVEQAPVDELFYRPRHPYTWGLLGSLPRLNAEVERLVQIPGQPPSLLRPPKGCRFHPRCSYAMDVCRNELPPLEAASGPTHLQRCWLDDETKKREAARIVDTMHEVAS
jgi:oligopeptide/dipeptide ABC transporter ATP-binding protein